MRKFHESIRIGAKLIFHREIALKWLIFDIDGLVYVYVARREAV